MAGRFKYMGLVGKIITSLSFIRGARWLQPSESRMDPECAVMEFDIELEPEKVNFLGIVTIVLRAFIPALDTDHPIFEYLGRQQVNGEPSRISITLSIKQTKEGQ